MKPPKDVAANVGYRRQLTQDCLSDKGLRRHVRHLCATDFLFWVNSFAWCYSRQGRDFAVTPFVSWPYQDEAFSVMEQAFGVDDVCVEKSRDMGASWMILTLFLHRWQFWPHQILAIISRNENLVDKAGDPDSLMWKLDFLLKHQPKWLVGEYARVRLHLQNLKTGSVIDGYSTTGDILRGGRKTAAMLDEFGAFEPADGYAALAATQHATNCRFFNSTPKGATGAFYDCVQNPSLKRITMHWTVHPEKSKGLFVDDAGKKRSPWYDRECRRMPIPALIAQELDIDYSGASARFFDETMVSRLLSQDARPPLLRGRMEYAPHDPNERKAIRFVEEHLGPLELWMHLKAPDQTVPADEEFVIGCDVSQGTGATNSALSVVCKRTREKVCALATPNLDPTRFADLVCALAHYLNEAMVIWEMNGPGGAFGKRLVETLGYRNVYWRQDEQGIRRKLADGGVPGWHASPVNKLLLFREYARALNDGHFLNRSYEALTEHRQYVYLPNGSVGNARARASVDPSGAGQNHGDRVTADALANKGLPSLEVETIDEGALPADPAPYTFGWRRQQWENENKRQENPWQETPDHLRTWLSATSSPW